MKSTQKNMISAVISQFITLLTGFLVQRYVLLSFGSDINGLTLSITQILSYLLLLEAGLTTASMQALYKPIVDNNYDEINGILSATKRKFLKIGTIFLCALGVSAIALHIVLGDQVNFFTTIAITIASGISTGLSYMLVNKFQALLYSDDKTRIIYNLTSVSNIIVCIVKIVLMKIGASIIFVQAATLISVAIKTLYLDIYISKKYLKISYKTKPRNDLISKSNNVFIHQIAGFVHNNTDVLIITFFSTLKNVSLYSVYNLIYSHISSLLQSVFVQAPLGYFGKCYARDKVEFNKLFRSYELIYTNIMFTVLTAVMIMTMPFVTLYTEGVTDMNYIDKFLAWLFYLSQVLNLIRVPSIMVINVSGYFKETQKGAIAEAVINIAVSLPLFFSPIGIRGLLVGTIAAMIYRSIDVTVYTYKNIFRNKFSRFILILITHLLASVLSIAVLSQLSAKYATTWLLWGVFGIFSILVTAMVFAIVQMVFFRNDFRNCIKVLNNFSSRS